MNNRNCLKPIGETFNSLMNWADRCFTDVEWPILNQPFGCGGQIEGLGWKCFDEMSKTRAYTTDDNYVIEVSVGEAKDADISITTRLTNDPCNGDTKCKIQYLDLEVGYNKTNKEKKADFQYEETSIHMFKRSFTLPCSVKQNAEADAVLKDGVLTIKFPIVGKAPSGESKKINVKKA